MSHIIEKQIVKKNMCAIVKISEKQTYKFNFEK